MESWRRAEVVNPVIADLALLFSFFHSTVGWFIVHVVEGCVEGGFSFSFICFHIRIGPRVRNCFVVCAAVCRKIQEPRLRGVVRGEVDKDPGTV